MRRNLVVSLYEAEDRVVADIGNEGRSPHRHTLTEKGEDLDAYGAGELVHEATYAAPRASFQKLFNMKSRSAPFRHRA